ncbi:MAG: cytochrome b/b6 domain-containing protein [Pseudomonadota bacterium]|nr:cytochrome b/b6 domain-containing protein [Pseudomonadota bacterium]
MTANTLPSSQQPGAPAAARPESSRPASRRVTDAATRMQHWLMALSFTGAYLSGDSERWRLVHVTLGYTLAGLLVCRLLWGLFGPRQARLSMLWRKLQGLPGWLKSLAATSSLATLQPAWRQGQNLLMALAVALILALILPLSLSGYAVWDDWGGDWLEEVHEFFGNALLIAVLAHVGLIAGLSLLRRKNQALPMLTGRVAGAGPDLARRNHGLLAALLLACVLGFWAWQWNGAPQSPLAAAASQADNERSEDHDDD